MRIVQRARALWIVIDSGCSEAWQQLWASRVRSIRLLDVDVHETLPRRLFTGTQARISIKILGKQ